MSSDANFPSVATELSGCAKKFIKIGRELQHVMTGGSEHRFVSHTIKTYAPKPGDILCAPRGEAFIQSIHNYNELRRGAYHCDLVVEQRPGELDVIGGNVMDAVSLAHIKLVGARKVIPTKARPWMLVIEQRD